MHRGTAQRAALEPRGAVAIADSPDSRPASGWLAEPGERELRTPLRIQLIGPAPAQSGARWFHLGVGLASASIALAGIFVLRGKAAMSSRVTSLLWLAPAAWALWRISTLGGPSGATALASSEAWEAHAPVFAASLLLGVAFRSKAG